MCTYRAQVTNWRILFGSRHPVDPGYFSIFWPTVERVERAATLALPGVKIATSSLDLRYVVWGIPRLLRTIERARSLRADPEHMTTAVRDDPQRTLSGTTDIGGLPGAQALLTERGLAGLADVAVGHLTVLGVLAALELTRPSD